MQLSREQQRRLAAVMTAVVRRVGEFLAGLAGCARNALEAMRPVLAALRVRQAPPVWGRR